MALEASDLLWKALLLDVASAKQTIAIDVTLEPGIGLSAGFCASASSGAGPWQRGQEHLEMREVLPKSS